MNSENTLSAINLFDYMQSKFHAFYGITGENASGLLNNHRPYYFEKLNYMAMVLDRDFNGDFKQFVKSLEDTHHLYTHEELEKIEFTG